MTLNCPDPDRHSGSALDLGGRVAAARGLGRPVWLAAAAITMGGGIWSMHFVAMLAFIMPTPMSYDIGLTTLSLVVAIFVTGGGFYVISRHSGSPLRLVLSGIFMGLGIAAMHYIGMAAMREHVELSYDSIFVALSLIIAIGASTAALWLAFRTTDLGQNLIAAAVMGLAISGMHYTAMGGTTFAAHGPVCGLRISVRVPLIVTKHSLLHLPTELLSGSRDEWRLATCFRRAGRGRNLRKCSVQR
jgi:NO-binding membrane sensor protein with MHYT domain